jgi:hypothetical protein
VSKSIERVSGIANSRNLTRLTTQNAYQYKSACAVVQVIDEDNLTVIGLMAA